MAIPIVANTSWSVCFRRKTTWKTIARSVERRAIEAFTRRGSAVRTILVLAGMHGDEPKGVFVARRFIELLSSRSKDARGDPKWVVIPLVNPDGYAHRKRCNARGVDLNRNFPTRNWAPGPPRSRMYGGPFPASEPETGAVIRLVERLEPDRIVTIHSIGRGRYCNNYDGPGLRLAKAMGRHNGYPVRSTIGYPTPGSFGAWAGVERRIPVLTLELPSHHSAKRCWDDNREALLALG